MLTISSVIFLCILCNLEIAVAAKRRIIGGNPTNITTVPYQLSLDYAYYGGLICKQKCGAVIIDKQWALTAAHCVRRQPDLRIHAGGTYKGAGDIYSVEKIIPHEDYNESTADYDIALLKLKRPFRFSSFAKPIPLATEVPPAGTPATVSGWGVTENDKSPAQLHKVKVEIISSQSCSEVLNHTITERMVCAGSSHKNICKGDSGGPLESGGKLIGIVSWLVDCISATKPGVYANVVNLRSWIKDVILSYS